MSDDYEFLEPSLRNCLQELGGAVQQHRASQSGSRQLFLVGLLAGIPGVCLLALSLFGEFRNQEHETAGRLFIAGIATLFILIGAGFCYWSWASAKRIIFLCVDGLVESRLSAFKAISWDEIVAIEVQLTYDRLITGLLGHLFKKLDTVYHVHATDDRAIVFAASNLMEAQELYLALDAVAIERFIPITVRDLR